jgi:hypothetical protein
VSNLWQTRWKRGDRNGCGVTEVAVYVHVVMEGVDVRRVRALIGLCGRGLIKHRGIMFD